MVSIVIPIYNQHELTMECITSVRENTLSQEYEFILVDNASDPPITKPYAGFVDVTIIRNESNLGFPAAVNQGVRASRGEIIVLLNNDVIVTPGWLDRMLTHLEHFDIVGPLTNYSAGRQRFTIPVYENKEELYRLAEQHSEHFAGDLMETNWVVGFCFLFRKSIFDEIGEFDESVWPSSGEELDFCFRAKKAGYRVGIARDVYVHHEGSKTFSDLETAGTLTYEEACEKSANHLKKTWGDGFMRRQAVTGSTYGKGVRLNLGCGYFHKQGFINIDINPEVQPDIVCDILDLPFEPGTVDEIYAGHVLEHFHYVDGIAALQYWNRLLKQGGRIYVIVPDYDYLVQDYLRSPTPERLREMNDLYIYSYGQKSPHMYAYNGPLLKQVLEETGFTDVEMMPRDHKYYSYPVQWQVGYGGVKA